MGTETLGTFLENLKLQFGNNTSWATPTDFYTRWLNKAYIRLTTQDRFWGIKESFHFPELETSGSASTVDGTAYVSTPSGLLVARDVYDGTNNRRLNNITWRTYLDYTDRANTNAEGQPTEWVRSGSYIYLHPTPGAVYSMTIYYRKVPTELSGSGDTTVIGTEWDEPILTLAAYIGKMWTMDYEKAKVLKEEFLDQVRGVISLYGEERKAADDYMAVDYAYRERGY